MGLTRERPRLFGRRPAVNKKRVIAAVDSAQGHYNDAVLDAEATFRTSGEQRAKTLQKVLDREIPAALQEAQAKQARTRELLGLREGQERTFADARATAQTAQTQLDADRPQAVADAKQKIREQLASRVKTTRQEAENVRKAAILRLEETRTTAFDEAKNRHDQSLRNTRIRLDEEQRKIRATRLAAESGQTPEDAPVYTPEDVVKALRTVRTDTTALRVAGLDPDKQLAILAGLSRGVGDPERYDVVSFLKNGKTVSGQPITESNFKEVNPSNPGYEALGVLVELSRIIDEERRQVPPITPDQIAKAYKLVFYDPSGVRAAGLNPDEQLAILAGLSRGVGDPERYDVVSFLKNGKTVSGQPITESNFKEALVTENVYPTIATLVKLADAIPQERSDNPVTPERIFQAYRLVIKSDNADAIRAAGLNPDEQLAILAGLSRGVGDPERYDVVSFLKNGKTVSGQPITESNFIPATQVGTAYANIKALLAIPDILEERNQRLADVDQRYRETSDAIAQRFTQATQEHAAFTQALAQAVKETTIEPADVRQYAVLAEALLRNDTFARHVRAAFPNKTDEQIRQILSDLQSTREQMGALDANQEPNPNFASVRALQRISELLEQDRLAALEAKGTKTQSQERAEETRQNELIRLLPPIPAAKARSLLRFARKHPRLAEELLRSITGKEPKYPTTMKNLITSMRAKLKHDHIRAIDPKLHNPGMYEFLRALDDARQTRVAEIGRIGSRSRREGMDFVKKAAEARILTDTSDSFINEAVDNAQRTSKHILTQIGHTLRASGIAALTTAGAEIVTGAFAGEAAAGAIAVNILTGLVTVPVVGPVVTFAAGTIGTTLVLTPIGFVLIGSSLLVGASAGAIHLIQHRIRN